MKTYTYTVFLRHPETKETQHGTIQLDCEDGYLDCHELFVRLTSEKIKNDLYAGYTLIAIQIVSVD